MFRKTPLGSQYRAYTKLMWESASDSDDGGPWALVGQEVFFWGGDRREPHAGCLPHGGVALNLSEAHGPSLCRLP